MKRDMDEAEYLAPTQLKTDPTSFVQVVKEVFLHEHACSKDQQIADVVGVDKSRISQMFGNPAKLKAESIQNLLGVLRGAENKRRIVEAWTRECFGVNINARYKPFVAKQVTEKTIRSIDKQFRQGRLAQGMQTATEAFEKAEDISIGEQLLDRVYFAQQRLDQPGQAMSAARIIVRRAEEREDMRRLAGGHLFRARVLLGLGDSTPNEINPILDYIDDLLAIHPAQAEKPPYFIADGRSLEGLRMGATLTFAERGMQTLSTAELRRDLATVTLWTRRGASYQSISRAYMFATRIHLLLGETFLACESIEKAFHAGNMKNLNILETCALLEARVMARTEPPEKRSEYLRGVIGKCIQAGDPYHRRLAETDLARVENERFLEAI